MSERLNATEGVLVVVIWALGVSAVIAALASCAGLAWRVFRWAAGI
jgi:hypothetical protein